MISAKENNRKPLLLRAIVKTFGRFYIFVGLIQLLFSAVLRLVNEICEGLYDNAACEDSGLLRYNTESSLHLYVKKFQENVTHPMIHCHIPEGVKPQKQSSENLKSRNAVFVWT
jgi:hypothetical protein